MIIQSLQNEKIKKLTKILTKNNERKKLKIFAVEGKQENERALKFDFEAVEFFICEDIFGTDFPKEKIHLVSREVYEKIAYRGSSEGIIGIYKEKETSLNDFKPKENSSVIVLESIEKPGNLGAVLRSCEAFGIDALVITDSRTDFYNPNVIRSSVGCLFGMNFFQAENQEVVDFLKNQGMQAKYDENTIKQIEETQNAASAGNDISERDELFEAAGRYIIEKDKSSIGNLQRNFKIGFNRAARIMDQLASAGVVGGEAGTKKREILMNMDEFLDIL